MKRIGIHLVIAAALTVSIGYSFGQSSITQFTCIGASTASTCSDSTMSLRQYPTSATKYLSVSGYRTAADGGAGEFYDLGPTPGVCNTPAGITGSSSVGSTTISSLSSTGTTGLTVGELVSASGTGIQTQPGTEIANIISTTKFTVTLPLTGTGGSSLSSITFTADNGGTLIVDFAGDCYQKIQLPRRAA